MKRIGQCFIALALIATLYAFGECYLLLGHIGNLLEDSRLSILYFVSVFSVICLFFCWQRKKYYMERLLLLLLIWFLSGLLDMALAASGVSFSLQKLLNIQDVDQQAGAMVMLARETLKFYAILAAAVISQTTLCLYRRIYDRIKLGYWFW